jgi:hypothetical protein
MGRFKKGQVRKMFDDLEDMQREELLLLYKKGDTAATTY